MANLIYGNAQTHKKDSSLIRCDLCGKILGYLNYGGYQSLSLALSCGCSAKSVLEYNYTPRGKGQLADRPLISKDSAFDCNECGEPLLSLKSSELNYFACAITCKCGTHYTHLKIIR